jgi:V/A-type H+/Na+-transporting ATPase subunit D
MSVKFQYNKTSLQDMQREMSVRVRALPVLKNKEAALRTEVKKTKQAIRKIEKKLEERKKQMSEFSALWKEFDMSLVQLADVRLSMVMIAGVKVPELFETHYEVQAISLFNRPHWFADGIEVLKDISDIAIRQEILSRRAEILDKARKKTTQKVNLYEKNQIPAYSEAILKIKRFLEDEENLAKSCQKILKSKMNYKIQAE